MGGFRMTFVNLTKFETEEAVMDSQRVRATDLKNVATVAVKASRLYWELNLQMVKHLTLSSELTYLHSRIKKLEVASSKIFDGDISRMHKIEELKETVRVTEDSKSCAVREYERIKEILMLDTNLLLDEPCPHENKSELERLDKERQNDFMAMLRGFVLNQAGYAEKMANVCEELTGETSRYVKDSS
ncbi:Sorting nexin 2A [Trema orientale]|uniref:Sorting nexin 2A n=1 Tax=Trema orientale TaxID=63057 RepID=A0A2P5ECJ2_TREOI|nr:Sorting nexin 2A [Trema orientale]